MTADDLNAPLGQQLRKRRLSIPITTSQVMAAVLTLFLGVFVVWAVVADNPFGGEPIAVVPINLHPGPAAKTADGQAPPKVVAVNPDAAAAAQAAPGQTAAPPAATKTITIIDGKTGERKEVELPAAANDAAAAPDAGPLDQKFLEMSAHGAIPKIAADGMRPADAFAQPVKALPGKPDAPRIAIIVSGLGVSDSATADAIAKLPGAVTLGFMPYGSDVAALAGRARARGHEVLLQVPMEPFDYPDNDPGPADAAHLADAAAEHRPAVLADEPVPRLCRHHRRHGRTLHRLRAVVFADTARNRQARPDFCRRRRQPAEPRRPHRRRQQPALRQGRRDHRCGADGERDRPRARPPGNGGARAQLRRRHIVRAAGLDRPHRRMGQGLAGRGLLLVPVTAVAAKPKQI